MCDFCSGKPGDHDKPYEFGNPRAWAARLTTKERRSLIMLKQTVYDARQGYPSPAAGDIAPDGGEWKYAQPEDGQDAA